MRYILRLYFLNFYTIVGQLIENSSNCVKSQYLLISGRTESFENAFEDTNKNPGGFALAFYSGLYSYAGWYESINFMLSVVLLLSVGKRVS